MTIRTQLEDLSNEVFLDIFEYLDANDIFFGFTSLNLRISLLVNSIPLHVNIHRTYCRHELEFLSYHLKFHSDQIISLQVHDQIFDQTNVIAYLFHQHDFINLHSCIFYSINSSSELKIVVEKLSKLPKIVLFRIIQSCNVKEDKLNRSDASEFSQLILIDTPLTLRSTSLYFHYNHSQIATISKVTTNLTHLQIIFYGTLNDISIYSLIPLLRIHRALRTLCVTIKSTHELGAFHTNMPNLPFISENDLPIATSIKSFDLQIVMAPCDIYSIGLILHCMPNLYQFVFTLIRDRSISRILIDLIDGQNWQEMLTIRVPYLKKFDFHISWLKYGEPLDLNNVVNSFRSLVNLYHQWDMCISRWEYWPNILFVSTDHIHMWTLNYNRLITRREIDIPSITMTDTFCMESTNISNLNNRQLNFHYHKMEFFMPSDRTTLSIQLPIILPFENITYIVCHLAYPEPSIISFLQNTTIRLKRIVSLFTRNDDDSQKYFDNLSRLVHLSNVDTIEFTRNNDIRRLNVIERVLLACPNVQTLIINSSLIFSTKVLKNSSLWPTFNQLNRIRILSDEVYIYPKYVSEFVQRFPSLTIVELEVYSIKILAPIVDILLSELSKLCLIVIQFKDDYLLSYPFSCKYIIDKRRQTFGLSKDNEDKVCVKLENQTLYIHVT